MGDSEATSALPEQTMAALAEAMVRAQEVERQLKATVESAGPQIAELHRQLGAVSEEVRQHSTHAASLVKELEALATKGKSLLDQVEDATRKANSESGFAYNAKLNAEEHAKVIAQVRGAVEVDAAAVGASKASSETQAQAVAQARATVDAATQAITATRDKAVREAEIVNSSVERAQASMPAIEKGSADANAISASKASAEAATAAIQTLQSQASELAAKAAADAASVAKADQSCAALVSGMAEAKARADGMNTQLAEYEQSIQKMQGRFTDLQAKIEGLLPGATSAGLAAAFHAQKERFFKPQRNWLILFVVAIAALLGAAVVGLPASSESWDAILRHLVNRLPLVGPLIWLAIYSGHHYNMALRMQEEYAFKEAVSRAFEGYKREMEGIDAATHDQTKPLVTLCENVLQALAERPGRIYEGRIDVATPLTPFTTALKDLTAAITKRSDGGAVDVPANKTPT